MQKIYSQASVVFVCAKILFRTDYSFFEKNFIKRTSKDSFSKQRFAFLKKTLGENLSNIERILEIGCGDGCNLLPYHQKAQQKAKVK